MMNTKLQVSKDFNAFDLQYAVIDRFVEETKLNWQSKVLDSSNRNCLNTSLGEMPIVLFKNDKIKFRKLTFNINKHSHKYPLSTFWILGIAAYTCPFVNHFTQIFMTIVLILTGFIIQFISFKFKTNFNNTLVDDLFNDWQSRGFTPIIYFDNYWNTISTSEYKSNYFYMPDPNSFNRVRLYLSWK